MAPWGPVSKVNVGGKVAFVNGWTVVGMVHSEYGDGMALGFQELFEVEQASFCARPQIVVFVD